MLNSKLKKTDPEIQNYISALKKENLKLQKQIVKLQAKNVTLNNRITALGKSGTKEIDPNIHELISYIQKMKKEPAT
jgi:hypothetical protein